MKHHNIRSARGGHRRLRLAAASCALLGALAAGTLPAPAGAQPSEPVLEVNLPAQPLALALQTLSRQAGLALALDSSLVDGKNAAALSGSWTLRQALDRLLAGTGLAAELTGSTVVVRRAPPAPAATARPETTLPPVRVTALAEPYQQRAIRIDRQDIERGNPSDLQDLFRGQASIQVGSSLPMSQKLYVNGVEETNLAVAIDGSRQNNKIFHHNATTLIDPSLLQAVRVDPGVAPADAGPGALAGSVAYETMDAVDMLRPGTLSGGFIKSEFESNGRISANSGALFGASGGFEYLGFLKFAEGDTRKDGSGTRIVGSGTDMLSGLAKLAYQSEAGHRFALSHESVKDDEARPYRANVGVIIGGRPVPPTRTYDLERQNTVLTYTDRRPTSMWDPKVQLGYSATRLGIPETDQTTDSKTDSVNGKFENRFRLPAGAVTAGIDFYADAAGIDYRYLPDAAFNEKAKEKARNVGLYSQARLDVNERTRASFGARFDRQRFTGVDGRSSTDSGWSLNASGEFDMTQGLTASAGYADTWAGIPLAENFIMNPGWTYPDRMDPVTGDSGFVALRAAPGGAFKGWSFDVRVFRTRIHDARTPDYRLGSALTKDMSSKGVEIGAEYAWTNGLARVRYADIKTRIDGLPADSDTGRYLTTPIGSVVTLDLLRSTASGLTFGANAQIVLKEKDTYDVDIGSRGRPLPSYEVANVFVEYRPGMLQGLTVRGEVNNLFDKSYASRATYGQEWTYVEPLREPGRSFKLVVSYRF